MTQKQQQKLDNLRKQVKTSYEAYNNATLPEESKKLSQVWLAAMNKLEAYQDKLYSEEA
jgi:hypothetical protein